jgi:hypothetical protein
MSSACVCHINVNDCDWCKYSYVSLEDKKEAYNMIENSFPMADVNQIKADQEDK